jgi:hypothetical protein
MSVYFDIVSMCLLFGSIFAIPHYFVTKRTAIKSNTESNPLWDNIAKIILILILSIIGFYMSETKPWFIPIGSISAITPIQIAYWIAVNDGNKVIRMRNKNNQL